MSKAEVVAALAQKHGLTNTKAAEIYGDVFAGIGADLKKNGRASIAGFGTFTVSKRAARTGRNPQTGATLKIKAANSVRFKPAPTVKELVQKFKVAAKAK